MLIIKQLLNNVKKRDFGVRQLSQKIKVFHTMFQSLCRTAICGLIINLSGLSATVAPAPVPIAEEIWLSDPRVNHLPQPMRKASLDFFDRFVQICAELNHRPEDTALTTVGSGSVIDQLAPAGLAVNLVDTPFMRFMDSTMYENGWGRTPRPDYPDTDVLTDFENGEAIPACAVALVPAPIVALIQDQTESANPVAQYFRAIMHMYGIRGGADVCGDTNVDLAKKLLILSMHGLCYPSARILTAGIGGTEPLAYAETYERLLQDPIRKKFELLKSFISDRGTHAIFTPHDTGFLRDVVLSLPGETGRWHEIIREGAFKLEEAFYNDTQSAPPPSRIWYNFGMAVVQTAAAIGYFNFSDSTDDGATWGEGLYFAANAAISWIETIDAIAGVYNRDIVADVTCGYLMRWSPLRIPFGFSRKTLSKEAHLVSIAWLLSHFDAAQEGTIDEQIQTLASDIKRTIHEHPVDARTNISKTIATHIL